jgi:hypothetical protein
VCQKARARSGVAYGMAKERFCAPHATSKLRAQVVNVSTLAINRFGSLAIPTLPRVACVKAKAEGASVATTGRQIETAPNRYLAERVGTDTSSERTVRWLIALMVLCCAPPAIALTVAASASGAQKPTLN